MPFKITDVGRRAVLLTLAGIGAVVGTSAVAAADAEPLKPGVSIEIAGSSGKFDFLRIDAERRRLLGAHENDGTWDVIDLDRHVVKARLKVGGAVDTALDPGTGRYFISVQEAERVAVVDAKSLKEVKSIALEGPSDAILFEPKHEMIYVTHDNGEHVWVIDPKSAKVIAAVAIPGAPEYMVYDASADRIYLNIKTVDAVVVIDPNSHSVVGQWATAPATQPHGLALDAGSHRVFASGANGKIVAISTQTGKVTATADIAVKVDQIAYDAEQHQIYCAGPDLLSVVQVTLNGLAFAGNVKTAPTARNVAVDPKTHAVWTTYTDGKNSYARSWLPQ